MTTAPADELSVPATLDEVEQSMKVLDRNKFSNFFDKSPLSEFVGVLHQGYLWARNNGNSSSTLPPRKFTDNWWRLWFVLDESKLYFIKECSTITSPLEMHVVGDTMHLRCKVCQDRDFGPLPTTHYPLTILTDRYSSLTTHHPTPTTHHPLPTTHHLLLTNHYPLPMTDYSLLATHYHYPPLTTYYPLLTTHYSLLTTHYSVLTTPTHTTQSLLITHFSLLTTHHYYPLLTYYSPPTIHSGPWHLKLKDWDEHYRRNREKCKCKYRPPFAALHIRDIVWFTRGECECV